MDAVCERLDSPIVYGVVHSLTRLLGDFEDILRLSQFTLSHDPWLALHTHDSEK